jgi:hypothetical protein
LFVGMFTPAIRATALTPVASAGGHRSAAAPYSCKR